MEEDQVPSRSFHAVILFDPSIHQAESESVRTIAAPGLQGLDGARCRPSSPVPPFDCPWNCMRDSARVRLELVRWKMGEHFANDISDAFVSLLGIQTRIDLSKSGATPDQLLRCGVDNIDQ